MTRASTCLRFEFDPPVKLIAASILMPEQSLRLAAIVKNGVGNENESRLR